MPSSLIALLILDASFESVAMPSLRRTTILTLFWGVQDFAQLFWTNTSDLQSPLEAHSGQSELLSSGGLVVEVVAVLNKLLAASKPRLTQVPVC